MILNPTHEITLSGLPSDVLHAYVRYKKGSRAIVTWLVRHGATHRHGVKTLPVKELAALARSVSSNIDNLPDVIHFHFKETITARRCLSKYFRENRDDTEDNVDTINHEFFTSSLSEIYEELCAQCCSSQRTTIGQHPRTEGVAAEKLRNHYACLPVEDTSDVAETLESLKTGCSECTDFESLSCNDDNDSLRLENDEITTAIETVMLLDRAQDLHHALQQCWERAGAGQLSFVAAAGITNVACSLLHGICSNLKSLSPDISIDTLHQRCCMFGRDDASGTKQRQHEFLLSLKESEQAVNHYIDGHELKAIPSCASCIQKPVDYVQSPKGSDQKGIGGFQIALMDNILHMVNGAGSYPSLVLNSTPCLKDVGHLLSSSQGVTNDLHCILNLHLLATTYKSFLADCKKSTLTASCRVAALKLAQSAASSVSSVLQDKSAFPCQCPDTLAYHLSSLEHDLNCYAKHKCWDLYFQSPWVAGAHMVEMLDILSYYGMRLFRYRHFVGSILHTYNVVQQLGGLDPIAPLDELCEVFKEIFFPAGGRNTTNFKNSWCRFIGARLKFKKGHKGHNHRDTWCMAVPPHTAKAIAGFGPKSVSGQIDFGFDYGRFDPLTRLKQKDYFYGNVHSVSNSGQKLSLLSSRPSSSSSSSSALSSPSLTSDTTSSSETFTADPNLHPLTTLANEIDASLRNASSNSLSTTKLNLLAVFTTCSAMVSKISDRIHAGHGEKETKNCICFTTTLLSGADRIIEGRRMGRLECWKKDEREVIEIAKQVMNEVMANVTKDRKVWMWDF